MELFSCSNCHNLLYFENNVCLNCGLTVGFNGNLMDMVTLKMKEAIDYYDISNKTLTYRFCDNATHGTCNWVLPAQSNDVFCEACNLNRTIPALLTGQNRNSWQRIEIAKHRLVYSLKKLGLPIKRKVGHEKTGIAFDFLANDAAPQHVMTGHNEGTITLNIEEADEVVSTQHKTELDEKYRTVLGHFRHEIGHYYWDVLLKNNPQALTDCRKLFGDDTLDYSLALQTYYLNGAPANWADRFISPYATSHPWEDWAETWAHYLHMMDTLETAHHFGININPKKASADLDLQVSISQDPYTVKDFGDILRAWLPLTFAVNSLNRSMGQNDFYPFFISEPLVAKLTFIHQLCCSFYIDGIHATLP